MDTIAEFADWVLTQIQTVLDWFKKLADDIFTEISDFIKSMWTAFTDLLKSLLLTLWDMLADFFCLIFEMVFDFVLYILDGFFSMFASLNIIQYISFPSDVSNIIGLIGLGQCMSFVVTALTIRFLLQLIPFVRLGS